MHATSGAAAPRPHPVRRRALPLLRHVGFICIPFLLAAAPLLSFYRDNQTEVELGALWWPLFLLALNAPHWRTPASLFDRGGPGHHHPQPAPRGRGGQRLDTPYQPGRRANAWLKHKHRHCQRLTVIGWRPGHRDQPDEVLVARRQAGGTLRHAGGVRFGLNRHERDSLFARNTRLAAATIETRQGAVTAGFNGLIAGSN
jgi:hypothetical protein